MILHYAYVSPWVLDDPPVLEGILTRFAAEGYRRARRREIPTTDLVWSAAKLDDVSKALSVFVVRCEAVPPYRARSVRERRERAFR